MLVAHETIEEANRSDRDGDSALFKRGGQHQASNEVSGKMWQHVEAATSRVNPATAPVSPQPRFRLTLVIAH